jgi:hypothetical protein
LQTDSVTGLVMREGVLFLSENGPAPLKTDEMKP